MPFLDLKKEVPAPASPANGYSSLYYDTNRLLHVLTHEGADVLILSRHTIQDEGVALTQRTKLNFVGGGVAASDNTVSGATDITIGGMLPTSDNSTIDVAMTMWAKLSRLLGESVDAGQVFSNGPINTYTLVYTTTGAYYGGVLAPNGDIHFVPCYANKGQKISSAGTVSTYTLVYTTDFAYIGGVLAPNGDIHFIPYSAAVGQKISSDGIVSTYTLVYTTAAAYVGGVLAPNGDIYFVPGSANTGQKISTLPGRQFSVGICCSSWYNKL